ncbi:MAG: class I SAM-dependent methyltransferase [Cellvibrionaceae bacterium]
MSAKEKIKYYTETLSREIRPDLIYAVGLINNKKTAIDCGCGAGADIEYLRKNEFTVFAFDIESEAIKICSDRFKDDDQVVLSQDSFLSYEYPDSSLVVADASLFFCPEKDFKSAWEKIYNSLKEGGIFCGSFLGPNDTMASTDYDREAYWPDVLVFQESELRLIFEKFEILKLTEHNISGHASDGQPHQWHIFSVVAKKIQKYRI